MSPNVSVRDVVAKRGAGIRKAGASLSPLTFWPPRESLDRKGNCHDH